MHPLLLISVILFVSLSVIVWLILNSSFRGWQLYETVFTESTEIRLNKLFLFADSRKILLIFVFLVVAVPASIYFLTGSLPYVILAALLLWFAPRMIFTRLEARRTRDINQALPDVLAQLAGAMRSGSTLTAAIEAMVDENKGPIGQEFSLLLREQRLGSRLEEALDNLGERVQSEEMDLVISAALIAQDVGGNLAEIFHRLSETIRKKLEMEGKIKALTAQGVMQGWVVSLLPFGILFVLAFIESEAIAPIFTGLLGWTFLTAVIVLEIVGGLMIRKIVSIDI